MAEAKRQEETEKKKRRNESEILGEELSLKIQRRIELLSIPEKKKMLKDLEKRVKLPGKMTLYPDIVTPRGGHDFIYSFSPETGEYFLRKKEKTSGPKL